MASFGEYSSQASIAEVSQFFHGTHHIFVHLICVIASGYKTYLQVHYYLMIPRRIVIYECAESTMDIAREMNFGDVVVALQQKSGRGRRGRKWFSPKGGLYFTIVLPKLSPCRAVMLSSVASAMTLEEFLPDVEIKWPNDVYVKNRKICGILSISVGNKTLIGVGINVSVEKFPENLNATSLLLEGVRTDIFHVLAKFLKNFSHLYGLNDEKLFEEWRRRMNLKGKSIKFGKRICVPLIVLRDCSLEVDCNGEILRIFAADDFEFI